MAQGNGEAMLTTPQVAERLGVSTARVRQLILAGRLPSQQFGRDHVIKESDLALVTERKTGRPAKKQAAAEGEASTATDASDDVMPAEVAGKPTKKQARKARRSK
jgi:excisionase family DNA binding protein